MFLKRCHRSYAADGGRTDGGEDAGEAEVVNCVEREQVEEELFLLLLAAQEGITLVQIPVETEQHVLHQHELGGWHARKKPLSLQ